MSTWNDKQSYWLHIQPLTEQNSALYSIYRRLLAAAFWLAALSLIVNIGFELPASMAGSMNWINFITVCLFLILTILRIIHARKVNAPIRSAIFELLLITALALEFIFVHINFPVQSRVSLHLIHVYIIALQIYFLFAIGRRMFKAGKRLYLLSLSPAMTVAASFLGLILLGAMGLMLPRATHGQIAPNISFLDALFTSTSAVCVTGLIVVDTATAFSRIGQAIILLLIQLGAFGIMIFVGLFAFTFGAGASLRSRVVLQDLIVKEGSQRVTSLLRTMLLTTFFLEMAGTLLLYPEFLHSADASGEAWFDALFHSISAFCNAGFSTFSNSLESYSSSPLLIAVICFLIFCGGIGFSAVYEIFRWLRSRLWRHKRTARLSLHTVTVLQVSGVLIAFGFLAVLLGADWTGRGAGDVFLSSLFQSITPRTAGFNTIPLASIAPWCLILIMILMFIGGAPGGTAGGVKV
ncbi:MAG: hypothetical protein JXR73_06315, partial [Candidatus Omnitrophica bacterium]|nr:hypothetical protein [Candidatus Omnitrophota bacterium]